MFVVFKAVEVVHVVASDNEEEHPSQELQGVRHPLDAAAPKHGHVEPQRQAVFRVKERGVVGRVPDRRPKLGPTKAASRRALRRHARLAHVSTCMPACCIPKQKTLVITMDRAPAYTLWEHHRKHTPQKSSHESGSQRLEPACVKDIKAGRVPQSDACKIYRVFGTSNSSGASVILLEEHMICCSTSGPHYFHSHGGSCPRSELEQPWHRQVIF